ncbi:ATP-grasp domain-containing protein [Methanobrevibacter olleyae]|uniref:Carbamoyl-phosphate synthase n=1 Tax=Methanobrevibacter olleyae TaxID=294671 RepID=A0A126QZC2_METOL|nr:ATP-grasp domain-containing protein [Methanobrevibacter olleyae]AMK15142.1 D-alanine-D-alanine ligase [Methanobrevibacter olleyae]
MKVLFIGSRLYDDVAYHVDKLGIESIITESNEEAPNLNLSTRHYIVPRGMDKPMEIAIKEEVDAIVPLLGIDPPLMDVAIMKEEIEEKHNIPVISSNINAVSIASDKIKTKEFFKSINLNVPPAKILNKNDFDREEEFIEKLGFNFPIVLKQREGQGGKDICIASEFDDVLKYFDKFKQALIEKFIEGSEVSIEVIGWNGEYLPLVPVYKGETNLEGIHPISRLRYGPCDFEDFDNEEFREIAKDIATSLKSEGTIDIDLIYSKVENKVYAIEINTRPSGTRYLSFACTGLNPLNLLVDIAIGKFNLDELENEMKDFYTLEIPIGNYKGPEPQEPIKEYINNNFILHGPKAYQRITIRGNTPEETYKIAKELTGNDYSL